MLDITYYTDPLCCWSWGFEPQLRRLLYEYEGSIHMTYRMSGLLPAWDSFNDPINNVSRPIQMGPVWMHAAQLSGMPINTRIWMQDPPASSYPACIAVCCAMLQSRKAGELYLRLLREAVMLNGINIARPHSLFSVAEQLALIDPSGFNMKSFASDFENGKGTEAFKSDMKPVRSHNINRFPTLVIKAPNGSAIMVTGYRSYSSLIAAIQGVAPQLEKTLDNYSVEQYSSRWPNLTQREINEVFELQI